MTSATTTARSCPQCGATVEMPAHALADLCSFCESPLVDVGRTESQIDSVAPFELSREMASGRLQQFLADQWLAPESVRKNIRADKLNGVLVPFYAYDGVARTSWRANIGMHWYETETYTETHDGKTEVRTRQVLRTEWFPLNGTHAATYSGQLVSASAGLPEAEANELEPFDLGKAVTFVPEAVAGWQAERPTVDRAEAQRIAGDEIAGLESKAIASGFLAGDTHSNVVSESALEVTDVEAVLLPVWIATYSFNGVVFRLLVNGQTGEVVGAAPRSAVKIACLIFVGFAAFVAALALFGAFDGVAR